MLVGRDPGEHRRVAGKRRGHGGQGALEEHRLRGQFVQLRARRPHIAVRTEVVCAERVDGDHEEVRSLAEEPFRNLSTRESDPLQTLLRVRAAGGHTLRRGAAASRRHQPASHGELGGPARMTCRHRSRSAGVAPRGTRAAGPTEGRGSAERHGSSSYLDRSRMVTERSTAHRSSGTSCGLTFLSAVRRSMLVIRSFRLLDSSR